MFYYLLHVSTSNEDDNYGSPSLFSINLIDKKGDQGMLGLHWRTVFEDGQALQSQLDDESCSEDNLDAETDNYINVSNLASNKTEDSNSDEVWENTTNQLNQLDRKLITSDEYTTNFKDDQRISKLCHKLVWFDYHYKCHGSVQTALLELFGFIEPHFRNEFLFHLKDGEVQSVQRSLLRTNCMDCLDRTNVVQVGISTT